MRALIRGTEICLENAWTKWQRMNMLFLTGKEKDADGNPLPGDGWTLVEDYQESVDDKAIEDPENVQPIQSTPVEEKSVGQNTETLPETVTIDGKTYTKDELLALLNQTS